MLKDNLTAEGLVGNEKQISGIVPAFLFFFAIQFRHTFYEI